MIIEYGNLDLNTVARRWWMLIVRGIAAVAFGVLALAWPGVSLFALVLLWGAYAFIDGAATIALAARVGREGRRWRWLLFAGIVSVAAAALAVVWPGITAFALVIVVGAWAVLTGIAGIAAAFELRHKIRGEWALAASGILSLVFGVLTLMFPSIGAITLVTVTGFYSIVFGVLLMALGFRLHRWVTSGGRPFVVVAPIGGNT